MQVPDGYNTVKGKVLKLKKAIYDLNQSSRDWNRKIYETLKGLKYKKSQFSELCVYVKKHDSLITIVALYVDDFFVFSNDQGELGYLIERLGKKNKTKDLGGAKKCLGMTIERGNGIVSLSQEDYVDNLLTCFNMKDCKVSSTPLEANLNLELQERCNDVNQNIPYQKLIDSLMYLACSLDST